MSRIFILVMFNQWILLRNFLLIVFLVNHYDALNPIFARHSLKEITQAVSVISAPYANGIFHYRPRLHADHVWPQHTHTFGKAKGPCEINQPARKGCELRNAECIELGPSVSTCGPCKWGFTGDPNRKCIPIDACKSKTAIGNDNGDTICRKRHAECWVAGPGEFSCVCKEGFIGDPTQECQEYNPCEIGNVETKSGREVCDKKNAKCDVVQIWLYECTKCKEGYEGDPAKGCSPKIDIDPCITPIERNITGKEICDSKNAECLHTGPGNYECQCRDGFEGYFPSIPKCYPRNACTTKNVDDTANGNDICDARNAFCLPMFRGEFRCICKNGFRGNGSENCEATTESMRETSTEKSLLETATTKPFIETATTKPLIETATAKLLSEAVIAEKEEDSADKIEPILKEIEVRQIVPEFSIEYERLAIKTKNSNLNISRSQIDEKGLIQILKLLLGNDTAKYKNV